MYVNVEVPEVTCVLYVHIFTELEMVVRKKKFGKNLCVFFNFINVFYLWYYRLPRYVCFCFVVVYRLVDLIFCFKYTCLFFFFWSWHHGIVFIGVLIGVGKYDSYKSTHNINHRHIIMNSVTIAQVCTQVCFFSRRRSSDCFF